MLQWFFLNSCKQAFYADQGSTNNSKLARGFAKEQRITMLSRNLTDNVNGEFYNPDIFSKT